MALKLLINLAKKIPGPIDYSSVQASCSIEGELVAGQDPVAESARLFAQAEAAVDRQLNIAQASSAPAQSLATIPPHATQSSSPSVQPANDNVERSARPYSGKPRAMATASQLRFLDSLIKSTRTDGAAILQEFEIGSLSQLSCRDCARLIDDLKNKANTR